MLRSRISCNVKFFAGIALIALSTISPDKAMAADPVRCEGLGDLQSISLTTWESGLGSWTANTHDVENAGGTFLIADWAVVGSLPDGKSGSAAFVANPEGSLDDCDTNDRGALNLDSPAIMIPAGTNVPRVSIDHWFDIEFRWDGGNFKISVNNGPFNMIPASAIEVGSYNGTLFEPLTDGGAEFNLNPLAGQDAYTGTIDGQPDGSWVQTHINLQGIATAGDTIKLRIDFGVDECGGNIGWYVDDVEVYRCAAELPPADTSLTLMKNVINDNGGSASASAWTLSAAGPTPFSGTGPQVTSGGNFVPGTYVLSENGGPSGYSASTWSCVGGTQINTTTIEVAQDEKATCTITNNDIAPTLKVVKTVINDNGGTIIDKNAFGLRVDGASVLHNITNTFDAGNHFVSEVGLAGYAPGDWGGSCNPNGTINLALGQTAVCTITNNDIAPTLKVVKTVVNDNGGTVTNPNSFGLRVDGGSVQNNATNVFTVGNHTVSEIGLAGYQAGVWGGDCNANGLINLELGEVATCTITNDDISPTIRVVKTIINDNGGKITNPNDFKLKVDGGAVLNNVKNEFDVGNHVVSETNLPDYKAGVWGGDCNPDGSITLALDQDAICTITNDDIDPALIIFKDGFE
jgi:hypothetical protein